VATIEIRDTDGQRLGPRDITLAAFAAAADEADA
jgi:hypothetical protein